jgi:hypothetical protein
LAIRGALERLLSVPPDDVAELIKKPESEKIRDAIAKMKAWLEAVNG